MGKSERPILFSAPMVRAILDGRKTQTRRICKLSVRDGMPDQEMESLLRRCPYGQPGVKLWVRETSRAGVIASGAVGVQYLADGAFREIENTESASAAWNKMHSHRGKRGAVVPSIFMPRWASRITLEITAVRVERLNDISEEDAADEGAGIPLSGCDDDFCRSVFCSIWQEINGADSWAADPWVWVISFRRIKP